MWGVVPAEGGKFLPPTKDIPSLPEDLDLIKGMATCHSLTLIDNELVGDPLDVKVTKILVYLVLLQPLWDLTASFPSFHYLIFGGR